MARRNRPSNHHNTTPSNEQRAPKRRRSTPKSTSFCAEEDLLFEIFKRLPIRTLIQLRLVCKSFNNFITSTLFINNHYSFPTHEPRLIVVNRFHCSAFSLVYSTSEHDTTVELKSSPFKTHNKDHEMIFADAILGVICLTSKLEEPNSTTILWNPTIHKYVPIPSPPPFDHSTHLYSHFLGFGFDGGKQEFKVVRVWMPSKATLPLVFDVLSSKEGGWRRKEVESGKIRPGKVISRTSFYMNGNIHWIAAAFKINQKKKEKNKKRRTEYYTMLMFDCGSEELRAMKLPRGFNRWREGKSSQANMFECKGMLSVNINFPKGKEIWGMEEYGVKGKWKRLSRSDALEEFGNLRMKEGMFLMDTKMEQVSYVDKDTPIYF